MKPQPRASAMTQEEAGGRFRHRARALPLGITQRLLKFHLERKTGLWASTIVGIQKEIPG